MAEQINLVMERDLMAATQLSGADHGILSRLAETETKSMRQQQLCDLMQWDRTRLSHHPDGRAWLGETLQARKRR
jgi:hypothetical protein